MRECSAPVADRPTRHPLRDRFRQTIESAESVNLLLRSGPDPRSVREARIVVD